MSNLLDKASILLTPTAYDNGSMLSVKPENGDGDFDFSRNSAATRVNAQGLVENVQIISPELVSNGNFSQIGTEEVSNGNFSQESSELVTNGDFATDSDWTKEAGWTISGGTANYSGGSSNRNIRQAIGITNGKTYKIQYQVTAINSGQVSCRFGGMSGVNEITATTIGIYTGYITATGSANGELLIEDNDNNFTGSIDNVSVKEVGQNWTLQNGWSIEDNKAIFSGSVSSYRKVFQENIITIGKQYKLTFEIDSISSGSIANFGYSESFNTIGIKTQYFTAIYDDLYLEPSNDAVISVTNISVKEVGQDWTFETGWSVDQANSKAVSDGTSSNSNLFTTSAFYSGNPQVKMSLSVTDYVSGTLQLYINNSFNPIITANGDYTFYTLADRSDGTLALKSRSFLGSVSNVSVKEITDDTNIPRINYEGFSYQDSLGSEEIVNGGFDTDSNWVKQAGWSISGGTANCDGIANNALRQNFSLPVGTLRIKFDVTTVTQGSVDVYVNTPTFTRLLGASAIGSYEVDVVTTSGADNIFFYSASNFIGSIDNVSVKEYLGQEVVPDSGCGSWLLEPQSTNLFPYSNNISVFSKASAGTGSNPIITSNYSVSPDGTMNADRIQFNRGSGTSSVDTSYIAYGLSLGTIDATLSIYLKTNDETTKDVTLRLGASLFDYDVTITPKWQRFVLSGNTNVDRVQILLYGNQNSQTADISCYGIQLEEQSYATSYIPTNGATNTRLQDIANNSGNSSLINSTEGVLYAEIAALADDVSISLSDNTFNNSISFGVYLDKISAVIRKDGGYITSGIIDTSTNAFNNNKIAIKYNSSSCDFYVNGLVVGSSSGVTYSSDVLDNLNFDRGSGHDDFFGKAKAVAVYKEALTDANLKSLTYPNPVATTFDLDFDTIAEQFTFTRGSEATFINAQGLIESTASNDAPRIDYSTGAEAFLLENQSTNLINYSEDFSQWITNGAVTLTSNYDTSPDGANNSTRIQGDNTSILYLSAASISGFARSIYVKATSGSGNIQLLSHNSNTNNIFSIDENWQRVEVNVTTSGTGSNNFYAFDMRGASTDIYDIEIWGAQNEDNISYATSYIPTSGASATRNQELCNNATPVINSEEGTLYAEISALANDGTERNLSLSDGTTANRISWWFNATDNFLAIAVYSGSNLQYFTNLSIGISTNFNKIAFKYKKDDFALWVNGSEISTDNSGITPIGLSELSFDRGDNVLPFFGNTKGLKVYPKALADVQLEDLTTI